jgi:hydroxymethylpyrimidine/phosphomethylpyrimidine kinase
MLAEAGVIGAVADALERHTPRAVVLDPVMVATSGARLLDPAALDTLRGRLLPLATVVTPNIPEAELLVGHAIRTGDDAAAAADALVARGAAAALVKGGHLAVPGPVVDRLHLAGARHDFEHARLDIDAHGTGCTLASAIAARLAHDDDIAAACRAAGDYVHRALVGAYRPGRGDVVVLDHFGAAA